MTQRLAQIRLPHVGKRFHFVRHLVEMLLSMQVGMMVSPFLLAVALGTSVSDARQQHDVAFALVMALGMTVPMIAVMLYRGHSRRSAAEMAAVMTVPAFPLAALKAGHVVSGPVSGPYMCASMLAMIVLIVYRRREYRMAARAHG